MPFVLLNYNVAAATAGASNVDLTAATDADFSQRNGHYIFTESYRLVATIPIGASITKGRYQAPSWNAVGQFDIFNVNRSLTPPSNTQLDSYLHYPVKMPVNEEFQVQLSNNLGAATEIENAALVLITDDWSAQQQQTSMMPPLICVDATFTVTPTLNAWSGPQALTFTQSLKGGVYSVASAILQGGNSAFFRLVFPRTKLYQGRKLRPGFIVQNAVGNVPSDILRPYMIALGEWGQFHTFEPVQCEVFGTAAVSTAYTLFLWLVYLGPQSSLYGAAV